jgi:hypothetical protein
MSMVELKVEVIASKGFVQAVSRLAECRGLSHDDNAAVVKLAKLVQSKINDLKKLVEENEKLDDLINESVCCQGCSISHGAIAQAGLAPSDVLALGDLMQSE